MLTKYNKGKLGKVRTYIPIAITGTHNLYGNSNIDECYQNLANAIVAQAVDDVVCWEVEKYFKDERHRSANKYREAQEALKFLQDESRLSLFTTFSTDDIDSIIRRKANMVIQLKLKGVGKRNCTRRQVV